MQWLRSICAPNMMAHWLGHMHQRASGTCVSKLYTQIYDAGSGVALQTESIYLCGAVSVDV